jgi:hypothetical protein
MLQEAGEGAIADGLRLPALGDGKSPAILSRCTMEESDPAAGDDIAHGKIPWALDSSKSGGIERLREGPPRSRCRRPQLPRAFRRILARRSRSFLLEFAEAAGRRRRKQEEEPLLRASAPAPRATASCCLASDEAARRAVRRRAGCRDGGRRWSWIRRPGREVAHHLLPVAWRSRGRGGPSSAPASQIEGGSRPRIPCPPPRGRRAGGSSA